MGNQIMKDKLGVGLTIIAAAIAGLMLHYGVPATTLLVAAAIGLAGSIIMTRKQRR